MTLDIETFSNVSGGSSFFKAIGHPAAAAKAGDLIAQLSRSGPVAVYDPLGFANAFAALHDCARVLFARFGQLAHSNNLQQAQTYFYLFFATPRMILSAIFWILRVIVCLVLSVVAFFVTHYVLSWLFSAVSGVVSDVAGDVASGLESGNLWATLYDEGSGIMGILPLIIAIVAGGIVFIKVYNFRVFR